MKNAIKYKTDYLLTELATRKTSGSKATGNIHGCFMAKTKRATLFVNAVLFIFLSLWAASNQAKAASFAVNTAATDSNDANPGDGKCDSNLGVTGLQCNLRAAAQESNAHAGIDSITFSLGAIDTVNLAAGELLITDAVNITGPGARLLNIQRTASIGNFRIFHIQVSNATVNISGITVANGKTAGNDGGGAGIFNNSDNCTLNLTEVTIRNNTSLVGGGGGILNVGTLNLTRSTISNNFGRQGGGINNNSGTTNISNSTISDNTADDGAAQGASSLGGGILNGGAMTLNNVTISHNSAKDVGGGIFNLFGNANDLRNTIIASNTAPGGPDISGVVTSQGNNLIGNPGSNNSFVNNVNGDKVGTAAAPLDAQFGALQNNGGSTNTRALSALSPAIDAGNNCVVTGNCSAAEPVQSLTTDQRGTGFLRQRDGNGDNASIVDIGAFESATIAPSYEADVSPRGNGDGAVSSTDVSVIQGFQLGFGLPYQSNEFQRADCAPFSTRGDGQITSIDVSQAQGYQLGFNLSANNTLQPAAGPTTVLSNLFESDSKNQFESDSTNQLLQSPDVVQAPREVRVMQTVTSAGQTVVVPIAVDAMGDESVYGFSLSYDSTKLSNPIVSIGNAGGAVSSNTTQAGQIGVSVTFGGGTIAAGNGKVLINVQFKVADNAAAGLVPIAFTNTPTFREVASSPGAAGGVQSLATTFTNDNLIITGPTAAAVLVSGRVITTDDRGIKNVVVSITDSKGIERTTVTSSFGYYSFDDVTAGETYIITVSGKRFAFAQPSQILNISEDTTEVNFIGSFALRIKDFR